MKWSPIVSSESVPPKQRLLIVGSDAAHIEHLSAAFGAQGYATCQATTGARALEVARTERPELALIDGVVSDFALDELAQTLRRDHGVCSVVVDDDASPPPADVALPPGVLCHVGRPLTFAQLANLVGSARSVSAELTVLRDRERHLKEALEAEHFTRTSVGVVMERFHIDREQAFHLLRRLARNRRIKISDIAQEVLLASEVLSSLVPAEIGAVPERHGSTADSS